jgi:hypothetical protein
MDSTTQTSDGDIKLNSDLFDLAEKLQIQLQIKEEELAKEKQEKQVCNIFICINASLLVQKLSTDLALEKARADKMETELASAQKMIDNHQMDW